MPSPTQTPTDDTTTRGFKGAPSKSLSKSWTVTPERAVIMAVVDAAVCSKPIICNVYAAQSQNESSTPRPKTERHIPRLAAIQGNTITQAVLKRRSKRSGAVKLDGVATLISFSKGTLPP